MPSDWLPQALVIGAPRCGTTFLQRVFEACPDTEPSSVKEPNHLLVTSAGEMPEIGKAPNVRGRTVFGREEYRDLWGNGAAVSIDVSPAYLQSSIVADRLTTAVPQPKVIVLLRDPIQRAWSHYSQLRRTGATHMTFPELWRAERCAPLDEPYEPETHLFRLGLYGRMLRTYVVRGSPLLVSDMSTVGDPSHLGDLEAFLNISSGSLISAASEVGGNVNSGEGTGLSRVLPPRMLGIGRRAAARRGIGPVVRRFASGMDRALGTTDVDEDMAIEDGMVEFFARDVELLMTLLPEFDARWLRDYE